MLPLGNHILKFKKHEAVGDARPTIKRPYFVGISPLQRLELFLLATEAVPKQQHLTKL